MTPTPQQSQKKLIWIIRGEVVSSECYSEYLSKNFRTEIFNSTSKAREGINQANQKPNLLIIEISNDDSHLTRFLEELRQERETLPTILISNNLERHLLLDCLQFGVSAFLEKPLELVQLENLANKVLQNKETTLIYGDLARVLSDQVDNLKLLLHCYLTRLNHAESALVSERGRLFFSEQHKLDYLAAVSAESALRQALESNERKITELISDT